MRYVLTLFFVLCSSTGYSQYRDYPISILKVHDGDTFTCTIDLGFDIDLKNQQVRVSNYDAWEINRVRRTVVITEEELIKGKKAKEDLVKIFGEATAIWARVKRSRYRDAYGRLLVQIFVTTPELGPNKDLGEVMTTLGNVRE